MNSNEANLNISDKQVYEVQIAGLPLKLKSSQKKETVDELIQCVDSKLKETMESAPNMSFQNALLLTALNLAEELLLLKKMAGEELNLIENRTQQILDQMEEIQTTSSSLSN